MRCSLLAVVAAACTSSPAATPRTQVRLEPLPAQSRAPADNPAPLPNLPSLAGDAGISGGPSPAASPRLASLTAVNQDVAVVVRELAAKFGLQYQIDPEVRGTVNTTLRNKTLPEALAAIIPQGVTYQIQEGVLRVGPARMTTRIFSLDYVALSRVGTASTIIQRRLGTNAFGNVPGGGGLVGGGLVGGGLVGGGLVGGGAIGLGPAAVANAGAADVISAVSVADVWEEARVAVEGLLFDAAAPGAEARPAQAAALGALGGIGSAGRPYSRVGQDGRRLIINPIAGTITVAAFPAQLEQIETFIRAFEASIQRQVLIEAKIVEVNLDKTYQYGIDWNILVRSGSTNFVFRSAVPETQRTPNTSSEFTLLGGSDRITTVINALASQGTVRVLSSPRVSALNNQRAVFDVTTGEIVFSVVQTPIFNPGGVPTFVSQVIPTQVNVGIVLDVLPQIGSDNTVTMNIRPVVTSVARTATFTAADGAVFQAPVIDTRESDTMARLRAGETIIIGGLMQTRKEKVRSGIPVLMDIPWLGALFTNINDVERKAELVIFLTPTIIAGQPAAPR